MSIEDQTEAEYLAAYDMGAFDRPSVSVDIAIFTVDDEVLKCALYRREHHPRQGSYALAGGFVQMDESLDAAAARLLRDKLGLDGVFIEQLYTFGAPQRDPRGRIITVAYYALVAPERFEALADYDALAAEVRVDWPGETGGPVYAIHDDGRVLPLFLDHEDVLGLAVKRLRGKLDYAPIGFQLLPEAFTLRALQRVHETIRGEAVNKDSFRRRVLASGQLEATGEREQDVSNRPAELYRFIRKSAL